MDYRGGGRSRHSGDRYGSFQGPNEGRYGQRNESHNYYPDASNPYNPGLAPSEIYNRFNAPTAVPHNTQPVPMGGGISGSASNISGGVAKQEMTYPGQGAYSNPYSRSQYSQGERSSKSTHYRDDRSSHSQREPEYSRDYSHGKEKPREERNERTARKPEEEKANPDSLSSIYELLKDERLKNVLFAGISKATAKLEESLKMSSSENIAFLDSSQTSSSQLFPSASGSQKPRSILKRKTASGEDENSSDSFPKSSALEKTLQLLQNKSAPVDNLSGVTKSSSSGLNALSQLSSYMDSEDDKYLYSDDQPKTAPSKEVESRPPFWSVSAVPPAMESGSKEVDAFDIKEQLYEQWRQSIHRTDDSLKAPKKDKLANVDPYFKKKISDKIESSSSQTLANPVNKDGEDLDTTVQNILQSIGFNFDLSKRMQELARQKKQQQDDLQSGIVDQSASFLDSNMFDEDLKMSLLRSGKREASLEALIKEARENSQKGKNLEAGHPSQDKSWRENLQFQEQSRRSTSHDKERARGDVLGKYDQWEHMSPKKADSRSSSGYREDERNVISANRRETRSRSYSRDRDSLSPTRGRYVVGRSDREKYIEKLSNEPKDEYFYPDEGDFNKSPVVPLLTSFSSRKKEDLSGGLLTKLSTRNLAVENLRVMSCSTESTDEPFMESRRIVLPAKQDKRLAPGSPTHRGASPGVKRKRSISPVSPLSKERKVGDYKEQQKTDVYLDSKLKDKKGSLSPPYSPKPKSKSPSNRASSPRHMSPGYKSGPYYRSPGRDRSPSRDRSPGREKSPGRDRSPKYTQGFNRNQSYQPRKYDNKYSDRGRSPSKYQNESERYFKKRSDRSHSPDYSRSSGRGRSRSPHKYTNRSPTRRRSRSTERYKRSPERYNSPSKTSSYRKKSPFRKKSTDQKKPYEKEKRVIEKTDKAVLPPKTEKSYEPLKEVKQEPPKVDVSKLPTEERKAYLQKLLLEREKTSGGWKQGLFAAMQRLAGVSVEDRKDLLIRMSKASPAEREKILSDLSQRQIKVATLKLELSKLKTEQNVLLRKSWRNGTAGKDPEYLKNEEQQAVLEQEIQRLSSAELDVPLSLPTASSPPPLLVSKLAAKPKPKTEAGKANSGAVKKVGSADAPTVKQENAKAAVADSKPPKSQSGSVTAASETVKPKQEPEQKAPDVKDSKTYFEYHDSGNYWCVHCNIASNKLDTLYVHFHGKKHKAVSDKMKKPWKDIKKDNRPARRVGVAKSRRVKGAELMFPVTGFYCTVCEIFCGDFEDSTNHLKSDSHYDKYMKYVEKNPMYEKSLLLSKASYSNKSGATEVSNTKGKNKKKNLRVTGTEESDHESDHEVGKMDIIEVIDMELDEDSVDQCQPKVPKLTGKQMPSWTSVVSSQTVSMKETKEDKNRSLDKFLSIAPVTSQGRVSQLPVVKESIDLSSIPIPEGPCLPDASTIKEKVKSETAVSQLPVVKDSLDLSAIPIPKGPCLPDASSVKEKVKSETTVQPETETKGMDVESGAQSSSVPVDQKPSSVPLDNIPLPDSQGGQGTEGKKTTSLDTLFARLSKNVSAKPLPKQRNTTTGTAGITLSEMEQKIQEEIQAKVEKEKQKLIRMKRKEEKKERKLGDEQASGTVRKKFLSDSDSSSDESDSDIEGKLEEEQAAGMVRKKLLSDNDSMINESDAKMKESQQDESTSDVHSKKVTPGAEKDVPIVEKPSLHCKEDVSDELKVASSIESDKADYRHSTKAEDGGVSEVGSLPIAEVDQMDIQMTGVVSDGQVKGETLNGAEQGVKLCSTENEEKSPCIVEPLNDDAVESKVKIDQNVQSIDDGQVKIEQLTKNVDDDVVKMELTENMDHDEVKIEQLTENMDHDVVKIDLTENMDHDQVKIEQSTENVDSNQVKIEQLTENVDDSQEKIEHLIENVDGSQEKIEQLTENVDDSQEIKQLAENVNSDQFKIEQLNENVNDSQEKIEHLIENVDGSQEKIEHLTENVDDSQEKIEHLIENVDGSQEKIEHLTEEASDPKVKEQSTENVNTDQIKIEQLTENVDDSQEKIEQLTENVDSDKVKVEQLIENVHESQANEVKENLNDGLDKTEHLIKKEDLGRGKTDRVKENLDVDFDKTDQVVENVDSLNKTGQMSEIVDNIAEYVDEDLEKADPLIENMDEDLDKTNQLIESVNKDLEKTDHLTVNEDLDKTDLLTEDMDENLETTDPVIETVDKDLDKTNPLIENVDEDLDKTDPLIENLDEDLDKTNLFVENLDSVLDSETTMPEGDNLDRGNIFTGVATGDESNKSYLFEIVGDQSTLPTEAQYSTENMNYTACPDLESMDTDTLAESSVSLEPTSNQEIFPQDSEMLNLTEPQSESPEPLVEEEEDADDQLTFGPGIVLSEVIDDDEDTLLTNELGDVCGKVSASMENSGFFTKQATSGGDMASVLTWELAPAPTEEQIQSGQGKDPPMSGVVSEVEPSDTDIVRVAEDGDQVLDTENSPTEGLSLGLDDDNMEFDIPVVEETGTD